MSEPFTRPGSTYLRGALRPSWADRGAPAGVGTHQPT